MSVRKNTYIDVELDWAEQQLSSWKEYVDANPLHTLEDRIKWKETKAGGAMPMVIASIEAQGKFVQETMKNYLALLKEVDVMREKQEAKKVETRGGAELGSMAEEFLKGRK